VQEALTNCVRHANATEIRISLTARDGCLQVLVSDDGQGLDPARRHSGLGLRGIDERVKELAGTMSIARGPDRGTTLTARLPLPAAGTETPDARVAG
jgi:signal transduction histidine kinase